MADSLFDSFSSYISGKVTVVSVEDVISTWWTFHKQTIILPITRVNNNRHDTQFYCNLAREGRT